MKLNNEIDMDDDAHGSCDDYLCQVCLKVKTEKSEWRPDLTGSHSAGNVCMTCIKAGKSNVVKGSLPRVVQREALSLRDHCAQESGLSGRALDQYISRHYGHD